MVNFSFPPGVLTQGGPGPTYTMGQPILTQGQPVPVRRPVLQGATGNARGSMRMPAIPDNRIGLNEMMMRAGAAMTSAAMNPNGGDPVGDMFRSYADSRDYNRQADMERMAIEEARALEEQRRQDLLRKMQQGRAKDDTSTDDSADATEIARLEGILNDLKTDPNLTGPIAGGIGNTLDRSGLGDPKRAAKRLILSELQVNATLAYTAQTKGAITDREMALFQTPVPKLTDDEQVWIDWLEPQLEVLKQLQQNGITDEAAKQQGITTGTNSTADDDGYTIEEVTPTNK